MRKHIVFIVILLIASISATVVLVDRLDDAKTNIRIIENVIYGDKSVAEGITVSELSQYDNHLIWDTVYKISAEPTVNTEYSFYSTEKHYDSLTYHGLNVALRDGYGCDFKKPAEKQTGIAKAYKELFDDTPAGEEKNRVIQLVDYYTYYPISLNIDIPDLYWYGGNLIDIEEYRSEKNVHDRFAAFFKIPMLETEFEHISVGKDIYGNLSMTGSGSGDSDTTTERYTPETVSAFGGNICYFSFSNRTNLGNAVDTSLIEGGYGIYKVNYTTGKYIDKNGIFTTGVVSESLSTCYPLSETQSVCEMWLSEDGKNLFCIILDTENNAILTQIETDSMETVASLSLGNNIEKYGICVYPYKSFSAIMINDIITVVSPNSKGEYELRFKTPLTEYVNGGFKWLSESAVMDYNGERLVVVGYIPEKRFMTYLTCDFYVAVYGSNGIEFYAEYQNSLSVNSYSGSYKANCHPEKLCVKWK